MQRSLLSHSDPKLKWTWTKTLTRSTWRIIGSLTNLERSLHLPCLRINTLAHLQARLDYLSPTRPKEPSTTPWHTTRHNPQSQHLPNITKHKMQIQGETHKIQFILLLYAMLTSTVLDFGGGGCFSMTTVKTPFSHLALIAEVLAFSGSRNFLISFWGAFLSSLTYLHPSSSPSSLFLFPWLLITRVLSSSTVTYNKFNQIQWGLKIED